MDAQVQRSAAAADVEQLVHGAYVTHAAGLQRYLGAMVRDRAAAEDLAQEAFLRLAQEAMRGRMPDNVAGWLFRVGANLAASRGRHAAVVSRTAVPRPAADELECPETAVLAAERNDAVADALAQLSDDHRRALVLAAHGYRGPEIAADLGRTPLATRALLFRARSRVRAHLVAAGIEA
jgi:RNA polymerase sigma-70 factor, ECF subfamily